MSLSSFSCCLNADTQTWTYSMLSGCAPKSNNLNHSSKICHHTLSELFLSNPRVGTFRTNRVKISKGGTQLFTISPLVAKKAILQKMDLLQAPPLSHCSYKTCPMYFVWNRWRSLHKIKRWNPTSKLIDTPWFVRRGLTFFINLQI